MQKYVFVYLLQPIEQGAQFHMKDWPLHITLSPRFAINLEPTAIVDKARRKLNKQTPVTATAANDEYFGSKRNMLVTIMDMSPGLVTLHKKLVATLEGLGAVYDEPQYAGNNYRAHATAQQQGRLNAGDKIIVNGITLIDMFADNDIKLRKVLDTVRFAP